MSTDILLDIIPEKLIIVLAFLAAMTCVFNWVKVKEYASLGYLLACIYAFAIYFAFNSTDIPDEQRRFWARLGYIIFLSNVVIWRVNFYIRQRKKYHGRR